MRQGVDNKDLPKFLLTDLLDLQSLQRLQDACAKATGTAAIIIDLDGNLITRPSNFSELCALISDTEKGKELCDLSNRHRSDMARSSSDPIYHMCQCCGFLDGCVPITIDGRQVAHWLVGQCNSLRVSREDMGAFAAHIGADVDRVLRAYDMMKPVSPEEFEHALALVHSVVGELSGMARRNLENRQEIDRLRQHEAELVRFRAAADCANYGVAMIDLSFRITYLNQIFAEMHGYSVEQLMGKHVSFLHAENQMERVNALIEVLRQHDRFSTEEVWHKRRDGSTFPTLMNAVTVRDDFEQPLFLVATMLDITSLHEAERRARENQGFAESVGEASPDLVYIYDLVENRLVYINSRGRQALETLPGVGSAYEPGLLARIIHPDDLHLFEASVKHYATAGDEDVNEYEFRIHAEGRDLKWYCCHDRVYRRGASGEVTQVVGIAQNVTSRKETEAALRKEHDFTSRLMETSPVGITVVDRDGFITYVNRRAERILGASKAHLLGRQFNSPQWGITDFSGQLYTDADLPFAIVSRTLKPVYNIQHAIETEPGIRRLLSINATPLVSAEGQFEGMVATIEDVTVRKKMEQALKESEEKARRIIEASPMGIYMFRLDDDGKMVIEGGNQAADAIIGQPHSELIGLTLEEAFPTHIDAALPQRIRQAVLQNETSKFETQMYKDGALSRAFWTVVFPVSVRRVAAMFLDVSESRKAEVALRESQSHYEELFNSVIEGVCVVDENSIIRLANPAFASTLEYDSVDQLIGRSFFDLIPEDQKNLIMAESQKRRNGKASQYQTDLLTSKGERRNAYLSVVPRYDSDGNYIGAFGTGIDITEMVQLRDAISRAQRLESAGRIAGQVAHDFNNLLGPLVAYPELVRESLPEDDPARLLLADIEKSALAIADINQQLLTLGRRGHYGQEILDVNAVLTQAIDQVRPTPEQLQLRVELADDLFPVKGGPAQILRVFSNLIVNARDAMHDCGTLTIRSENYYAEEMAFKSSRLAAGEYVKVTISDTGCGIPEDLISNIFEPFFTTKSADKKRGSGLGLSIVHAVMQDHGGAVDVRSSIGEGTSFYLYFPITREEITSRHSDLVVGGTERILVVDDEPQQRQVAQRLLQRLGYCVETVASGEEALEKVRQSIPDLVLLDMLMPGGMDGAETFEKMREQNPSIKAVIVSGYADSRRARKALQDGAAGFVKKPITLKAIAQMVREALETSAVPIAR